MEENKNLFSVCWLTGLAFQKQALGDPVLEGFLFAGSPAPENHLILEYQCRYQGQLAKNLPKGLRRRLHSLPLISYA